MSNRWHQPPRDLYHQQRPARSLSPRARIAAQVSTSCRWQCACGTTLINADWDDCVTAALDHADHCIESDHEGES
ncbi:MAG: hypothetical protein WBA38_04180 [Gordonia sp. (in: high G+C Gram-positive bacteria)]|uniref:hypothetical protein n=1 Tax=Gordonia sp. (in: high G+C Gram-positive bacteria) TaxID=84139 RepID=UPI003C70F1CA